MSSLAGAGFTIRPLTTMTEYHDCVALQEDTWGPNFSEQVSPGILELSQILGGVSAGAYDTAGHLVGFVFGMTGPRDGEVVHWSDMLAVRPEARDTGLGRRLKEYQRDDVLERGIEKMYWTFDPLQSRNAHLNLSRLGAVVREYAIDVYGRSDSPLHQGIGTDRFIALWLLSSSRVRERLSADGPGVSRHDIDGVSVALGADQRGAHPRPARPDLTLGNDEIRVAIPSDVETLKNDDMQLALEWRSATRTVFTHYLASGYEVRGFARGSSVSFYIVERVSDER